MIRGLASGLVLTMVGFCLIALKAQANEKSSLSITIEGFKNPKGQVCINLFSNSQGFPSTKEKAVQAQCMPVKETLETITFQNLDAGSYGVAVIHDANVDGKLNRNILGIPTEGVGFSNNPKIRTGPPKFGETVILVTGKITQIRIHLQYFLG